MNTLQSAGIILFRLDKNSNKEYLILQYNPTYWGLCKGGLEEGESMKDAAIREAKEETNLAEISFLDGFEHKINYYLTLDGERYYKEVTYFLGEVKNGEVKISDEHQDHQWLHYEEALARITHDKDKNVLIEVKKYFGNLS